MAFINDYLSNEEMEMFKKLNIQYPLATGINGIIGYSLGAYKLKALRETCTIDREEEIYFFYCGTERYDKENIPKEHYFYLLWNKELSNNIVTIVLEQKCKRIDNSMEYLICWEMKSCYSKTGNINIDEKIILKIKEALSVYGIDGNPDYPIEDDLVEFNF